MLRITCLLFAFCLSASMLYATDPPKLSPVQQDVLNVRNALRETALRRDFAAWSRYVADDCIFSNDDGELVTKAQFMEQVGKLPPEYDRSVNPRDYVIHVYGDAAVSTSDSLDTSSLPMPTSSVKCVKRRPTSSKTVLGCWLRGNGAFCP